MITKYIGWSKCKFETRVSYIIAITYTCLSSTKDLECEFHEWNCYWITKLMSYIFSPFGYTMKIQCNCQLASGNNKKLYNNNCPKREDQQRRSASSAAITCSSVPPVPVNSRDVLLLLMLMKECDLLSTTATPDRDQSHYWNCELMCSGIGAAENHLISRRENRSRKIS